MANREANQETGGPLFISGVRSMCKPPELLRAMPSSLAYGAHEMRIAQETGLERNGGNGQVSSGGRRQHLQRHAYSCVY